MPGRLLIEDTGAEMQSAARVIDFVKTRPVSHVLAAHIELDRNRETYTWGSQYHPQEHSLELTKEDLLRLPAALSAFNGFYTRRGSLILMNSGHCRVVRAMLA